MNTPMKIWDKILPDQRANNRHFFGQSFGQSYYRALYDLVLAASGIEPEPFKLEIPASFTIAEMGSNPIQLRLLDMLVRLTGAQRVLEIGSFIGLSAMTMARAGAIVITVEKGKEFAAICERNVAANGLADRVNVIQADATGLFREAVTHPYDLAFIDGDKEHYDDIFNIVDPLVRPGGMIIIDDVLFHGDVLNEQPTTAKGAGVRRLLRLIRGREDRCRLLLPVCNGLLILVKA